MINQEVVTCPATSLAHKLIQNFKFLQELVMTKTFSLKRINSASGKGSEN
jgi:hypothetical protein